MTDTPKLMGTDTLRQAYPKINQSIDRVNNFKSQIDQIVIEGDSSVEAAQARVKADGTVKATLKDRLDESDAQLAQKTQQVDALEKKDIYFKPETYGTLGNAAALSVIANEADPKPQVLGIQTVSELTRYPNRDSVGLYVSNRGIQPTVDHNTGTITYTIDTVRIQGGDIVNKDKLKVGMIIQTKHTPNNFISIIKSIDLVNQIITVEEGWYEIKTGGSTSPSIPSSGVGFWVNKTTALWSINNNIYIRPTSDVDYGVAQESGLFATKEGAIANGFDMVNFGNKANWGVRVRRADKNDLTNSLFDFAYLAQACDIAYKLRTDIPTRKMLSSDVNGNDDVDGYNVQASGQQSKLRLKITSIGNGVLKPQANTDRIFLLTKTIVETFNLPTPVNKQGEMVFLINMRGGTQVLAVDGVGGFNVNNTTVDNTLTLMPRSSTILVSNGTHWVSLMGSYLSGGGFLRQDGGKIDGNLDIANPSGTTILEVGSKTVASSAVIDLNSSGNNNDYDARFIVTGGTTVIGKGNVNLEAETFKVKNRDVATVRVGGAPQSNPEFIGQLYVDSTSKIGYIGVSSTEWKQITI